MKIELLRIITVIWLKQLTEFMRSVTHSSYQKLSIYLNCISIVWSKHLDSCFVTALFMFFPLQKKKIEDYSVVK